MRSQFFYDLPPVLLNMSLAASVVILFVLAARLALRRAPKVFSYILWAAVLFRMLCPVSVSGSYSLLSWVEAPAAEAAPGVSVVQYVSPETIHRAPGGPQPAPAAPGSGGGTPHWEELAPEEAPFDPAPLLTAVWLAGVAGLLAYSGISLLRLRRKLVGAAPLLDNIWLADHIGTPFVMGLLRPKIYLPSALSGTEQSYILLHEQYHIRRLDHWVKALSFLALCVHWFNPLVWLAFVLSGKDMEMSCDEAVVKRLGEDIRADYSASLLSLATGRRIIAGAPLAFGEGDTGSRIRNLLRWKRPRTRVLLLAGAVCLCVVIACAVNPAASTPPAPGPEGTEAAETPEVPETPETPVVPPSAPETPEPQEQPGEQEAPPPVDEPDSGGMEELEAFFGTLQDGAAVTVALEQGAGSTAYQGVLSSYWVMRMPTSRDFAWRQVGAAEYSAREPAPAADGAYRVQLSDAEARWVLTVESGSNYASLRSADASYYFAGAADYAYNDPWTAALALRYFYDTVEFEALGGGWSNSSPIRVPDAGQDYLAAALEAYTQQENVHLQVSPGSRFRYSFVQCSVAAAEEETAYFREEGIIDQNTWAVYGSTILVPENELAWQNAWAGNTEPYEGGEPGVPEGALCYGRVGYVARIEGAWLVNIVGTGW